MLFLYRLSEGFAYFGSYLKAYIRADKYFLKLVIKIVVYLFIYSEQLTETAEKIFLGLAKAVLKLIQKCHPTLLLFALIFLPR